MNIVALSDQHGNLEDKIPNGDILCIAGDICPAYDHSVEFQQEWLGRTFIPWCENLIESDIVKDIIFIGGNHDWHLEELYTVGTENEFRRSLPPNIHYLRDSSITIDGVKFYGTPWTPEFCNWAFMRYEGELDKIYEQIPTDTNVLISHGPPYGHNDMVEGRQNKRSLGSKALLKHIHRVKMSWIYVGHIHSGSHEVTNLLLDNNDHTKRTSIVNVSILDEQYKIFKTPFETTI